jgi:selenide,water dikinase
MRCGGCGAKVGATTLSRVLARLKREVPFANASANGVLVGLDSPEDCAVVAPDRRGRATVHTVDFFRSFVKDPYLFGKVAALPALLCRRHFAVCLVVVSGHEHTCTFY